MYAQTDKLSGSEHNHSFLIISDQSVCGLLCYQHKDLQNSPTTIPPFLTPFLKFFANSLYFLIYPHTIILYDTFSPTC